MGRTSPSVSQVSLPVPNSSLKSLTAVKEMYIGKSDIAWAFIIIFEVHFNLILFRKRI